MMFLLIKGLPTSLFIVHTSWVICLTRIGFQNPNRIRKDNLIPNPKLIWTWITEKKTDFLILMGNPVRTSPHPKPIIFIGDYE